MADETQKSESKSISVPLIIVLVLVVLGAVYAWKHQEAKAPIEVTLEDATTTSPVVEQVLSDGMSLAKTRASKILAGGIGAPVESITVVDVASKEWPDTCLGLAKEGEVCAQVVTAGYLVTLSAQGVTYRYRTDESANAIRIQK